ncbi:MAG: hypothetical protein ACUVX1_17690 [Chloroflexota bacterium]|mgnify:CR=1 FL=1
MEIVLALIIVAMFLLAVYAEGRHTAGSGMRVVSWEEFARQYRLDLEVDRAKVTKT